MRTSNKETMFWIRHAKRGTLISAMRMWPKRAIRFFGAPVALSEDETSLKLVIEARRVLGLSDLMLLDEIQRTSRRCAMSFDDETSQEIEKHSTLHFVAKIKRLAHEYLLRITGSIE